MCASSTKLIYPLRNLNCFHDRTNFVNTPPEQHQSICTRKQNAFPVKQVDIRILDSFNERYIMSRFDNWYFMKHKRLVCVNLLLYYHLSSEYKDTRRFQGGLKKIKTCRNLKLLKVTSSLLEEKKVQLGTLFVPYLKPSGKRVPKRVLYMFKNLKRFRI